MIKLMDMQQAPDKLPQVTSAEYTVGARSQEFHPEGLFSETIFGPKESKERKSQFAYIDLHCKILHPQLVKAVSRLNNKIIRTLDRKYQYNFDENDNLVEVAAEVDGELNGVTSVINNFKRIINGKTEDKRIRNDIAKMLNSYYDKGMAFIDKCIVIPAFWRDAQVDITGDNQGLRIPPVNEYYKKIINLSKQIATMPMNAPGDIFYEICASKMQQLVNELCDYLVTKVSKKSGIVRSDILGKRIDFCGRAVIVGGSAEIGPDEIGVPYKMLVKLYEPFLLHELYYSEKTDKQELEKQIFLYNKSTFSIVSLKQIISDIDKGHILPAELDIIIRTALERVIEDKALIGKRDPCLHAESVRAYRPKLVDGSAIKIAATCCTGHNADFDGDSCCFNIKIDINGSEKTCHISKLSNMKLFTKVKEYVKSDGIKVTKYSPNTGIKIWSIDLDTGDLSEKKITEYSVHENLKMYKISSIDNQFKDFWVSEHHSIITYDTINKTFNKTSPIDIKDSDCLIQMVDNNKIYIPFDKFKIELDPTQTTGYDFTVEDNYTFCSDDGIFVQDTMAIYTPLSKESIEEIKEKMLLPYSMDGMGKVTDDLSKDYCVGIYTLTKDNIKFKNYQPKIVKDDKDMEGLHPNYPIIYGGKVTTVGRVMFNKIVPDKSYEISSAIGKKQINKMISRCANEYYQKDPQKYSKFVKEIIALGGKYYTLMPVTFGLDELQIPQSILNLKEKLNNATPEQSQLIIEKMEKLLENYLVENQLDLGIVGGGGGLKGGYSQLRQILICKGIIQGYKGEITTIKDSYGSGMSSKDHFDTGYATRNGIVDRVLNTADTGYLSRRLAYALQRVECDPTITDCGSRKTISLKVTDDIAKRLTGRYVYNDDNKLELFDKDKWIDKIVRLRTPVYCRTTKLCRHCYGELALRNRTKNVGILAAQILGERLSQSTMKQFHVGGSISVKLIDVHKELTRMLDLSQKNLFDKQFICTEDSKLVSKNDPGSIIIKNIYYDDKKDITIKEDKIESEYGYFLIDMGNYVIDCTIDNKIEIPLQNKQLIKNEDGYVVKFDKNDVVFICVPTPEIFSKKVKVVENIFNGKTPYKSPDHYVMKVYNMYKDMECDCDMVQFETLVCNLLRDSGNPAYPARLNFKNYKPIIISLNAIPQNESWLEAFCFQNSKEAIMTGLLYDRNTEPTILERLVMSDI